MMDALHDIVQPWLMDDDGGEELILLRTQLTWLQGELFYEYEPNQYESFDDCLAKWLLNVSNDNARKKMFRLLKHIFFVGKKQFDALSRSAFNVHATRWLIDQNALNITNSDISNKLHDAVRKTWFCPITDSLRINSFLKVNGLAGHKYRPDWMSLKQFGKPRKIQNFVKSSGIDFLVLLEDFVGTGKQMTSIVGWASKTLPDTQILVVPLICCPSGKKAGDQLEKKFDNVRFSPCLSLQPELFVHSKPKPGEFEDFTKIRPVINSNQSRLGVGQAQLYGYGGIGALVTLYSNCPNNTLPLIHRQTRKWNPLFKRINRI